jgi:phage gp29-like protein
MMECVAFTYASHHIVWQPNDAIQIKLPSGKTLPSLSALFEYVPLEFFEARTGELRFLGLSLGYTGTPLAPNCWMVTAGPGLMHAASTEFYYKRLAKHDLLNFSEKFGTPGIEVTTTGAKDSEEGKAARDLAREISGNWRGVRYGADKNSVNFLWPTGGVSGTALPMHTITDDCKRDLAILWLGADLSTMSRGGSEKAVGSLAQEDEREKRERSDCAMISETLNNSIDPFVIHWFFGDDAPVLVKARINSPINEDRSLLGNLVETCASMGAKIPIEPVCKRLGVPIAKEGEEIFQKASTPETPIGDSPVSAINVAPAHAQPDVRLLGLLTAKARTLFPEALAQDFGPLREAFKQVLASSDGDLFARAEALYRSLDKLGPEIVKAATSETELYKILSAAMAEGLAANQ